MSAQYGFSSYPAGGNAYKCNIFVAHRAVQSGLRYSAIHGIFGSYPPLANELSDKSFVIVDWPVLSVDDFPQPGYITAVSGGRNGHCGIVDFDGKGISAGILNVNRYMNAVQISTTLRKYSGGTL